MSVVSFVVILFIITVWAVIQRADAVDNANIAATNEARANLESTRANLQTTRAFENQLKAEARSTRAYQNEQEAKEQARLSRWRELAALSDQRYLDDPNKSILMAVEAITTTYTSEAFGALRTEALLPADSNIGVRLGHNLCTL